MLSTTDNRAQGEFRSLALMLGIIIVAAIAFGVFVNTIVFLQDEVSDDTNEALTVVNLTGSVNDPAVRSVGVSDGIGDGGQPVVYELRLELAQPALGDAVDLTDLRVELTGTGTGTLHHVSHKIEDGELAPDGDVDGTDVARNVFFIEPVSPETPGGVLTGGQRYELVVPVGVFVDSDGALRASPTTDDRVAAPGKDYRRAGFVANVPDCLDASEGIDNGGIGPLESGDVLSVVIASEGGIEETVELRVPSGLDEETGGSVSVRP